MESSDIPFNLPLNFKSHAEINIPESSDFHSSHLRKAQVAVPIHPNPLKKLEFTGPAKPSKLILERNLSSSSSDNDGNDNFEDPILKQAHSQAHIIPTVYQDNDSSDEENDNLDDPILKKAREQSNMDLPKETHESEHSHEEELKSNSEPDEHHSYDYKALKIPCSHEVLLQGHSKSITAIALDHAGIRIATGSNDYKVRLWDFEGMNKNMNSFRILEPMPVHPIRNLSFNVSSHEILVIASNAQPKIINRDGKEVLECIKGDMYIKDMNQTRGHVSMVYDGCFHPKEKNIFGSCSFDGTIRFWDRNMKLINIEQQMTHKQVIKCKDQKGLKTGVTSMAFSNDGGVTVGSCLDGSLQGFSAKSHYTRPDFVIQNAVNTNIEVTKMLFFEDNHRLCVRALDHTMKIWDIRQYKKPLQVWYNLLNYSPGSKICFSPNQKYIVTGTSVRKNADEEESSLLFYDSMTFDKMADINMGNCSITDIKWHSILNQLFIGSTDNNVHTLYDPNMSTRGALLCLAKQPKILKFDEMDTRQNIINPHSLPLFKESLGNKRKKYEKMRQDPLLSRKPELPLQGPGKGGKIGGASTVTQFIMRSVHEGVDKREDPQKALLKYAEQAEKNPLFVNNAYRATQPKAIFDYTTPDYKEQELLSSINKICPGCGLKICKCSRKYGEG